MSTASYLRPSPQHAQSTAFDHVAGQLDAIVPAFDLGAQAVEVRAVYAAMCHNALDFPLGGRPAAPSRLNEDGMPLQLATSVGDAPAALRFVIDPAPLNAAGRPRMSAGLDAMRAAAELIGAQAEFASLASVLAELAPDDPALLADPAGAFWIGAAFAPAARPCLRVYVNGAWGSPTAQRDRLRRFASYFHHAQAWDGLTTHLPAALAPLGLALTFAPGGQARGTIYLRAFGLRLSDYVALARAASGDANAERIRALGSRLLGHDVAYPTASAVLSFRFGPKPGLITELEFCAHCLYANDAVAQSELLHVFAASHLDSAPYHALARAVASPASSRRAAPRLHSFVGADAKSLGPAYTVYMKPDLSAPR